MESRTVLIVEDEPDNRQVIRAIVEELVGARTLEASDGQQALELATTRLPDLILLDLVIPRLSGFEVARRLRSNAGTRTTPIIAITALALPSQRQEALAAGCNDYIDKPFDVDVMVQKIQEVLSHGTPQITAERPPHQAFEASEK